MASSDFAQALRDLKGVILRRMTHPPTLTSSMKHTLLDFSEAIKTYLLDSELSNDNGAAALRAFAPQLPVFDRQIGVRPPDLKLIEIMEECSRVRDMIEDLG